MKRSMIKNEGSKLLISQIEVAVFAHSTENASKVKKAVKSLLLKPVPAEFKIAHLKGHYGNPIRLITLTVSNPGQAYELFMGVVSRLDETCKEHLVRTLRGRMDDKGNLYLRFDKQWALKGELKLREEDPIRVKVKFRKTLDVAKLRGEILRYLTVEDE